METRLYEELRDITMEDATVYAYLKTQQASGASDFHTAVMLIRQLAKEKKIYFDQVLALTQANAQPRGYVGELHGVKIIAKPWWRRLDFWNYRKIAKGTWIKK